MAITFTRKPTKAGNGLTLWIPKQIVEGMDLSEADLLEITIMRADLE